MSQFLIGIAPEHQVALLLALLVPVLAVPGWRALNRRVALDADAVEKTAAGLLLTTGVIHIGLPLGHNDSPVLTLAFLGSGAVYVWLAWRAVARRPWRLISTVLLLGTLLAYAITVASGREEADQVGLATAVVELAALGLAAIPVLGRRRTAKRVLLRPFMNTAVVFVTLLFGVTVWIAFAVRHDDHGSAQTAGAHADGHDHHHGEFVARAQAGIILRPAGAAPTAEQRQTAAELAAQTKAYTAKYRDVAAAVVDGYNNSGPREGLQLHYEKKTHQNDGRIADPQAPEMLVYASEAGRTVLLGVVYQMPVAGRPGPAIGGNTTRWHAHNICAGLTPPGFGVVSPYGTCPVLTVNLTIAEMIHVWVVDPPGGPYVEHIDDAWVRELMNR
jgi:hypothetical protein